MARILVVDDNKNARDAMCLVLDRNGHECFCVDSAAEAKAVHGREKIDCMIIDVWMPEKDGLTFMNEIHDEAPDMPMIVASGGGPGRTLEYVTTQADLLGVCATLYKPFEDEELVAAVNKALG